MRPQKIGEKGIRGESEGLSRTLSDFRFIPLDHRKTEYLISIYHLLISFPKVSLFLKIVTYSFFYSYTITLIKNISSGLRILESYLNQEKIFYFYFFQNRSSFIFTISYSLYPPRSLSSPLIKDNILTCWFKQVTTHTRKKLPTFYLFTTFRVNISQWGDQPILYPYLRFSQCLVVLCGHPAHTSHLIGWLMVRSQRVPPEKLTGKKSIQPAI